MSAALVDDMGVANVGFLIESLGKDAGELQFLRELVQNSFEAINNTDRGTGQVEIDFESVNGVRKLRITDNGVGMTADEVRQNLNRLSASTGIQAFDKNFGVGAKITAAVRNPHGVMYKAWKNGEGSLTILGRLEGRYGRLGFRAAEDESVHYSLPLVDADKPGIITDSGVSVVLLGKSFDDDTTIAPPSAGLPTQWVAAYLERRYFQVPAGITLKVLRPVQIYDSGRGVERAIYDTVRGQRYYLDKHSDAHGTRELPEVNATVWWWILSESITSGGKTWNNRGHVAAVFQDELYEVRSGSGRVSGLKDFGIYAGHNRVVIYAEPHDVLGANTSRSALILAGGVPLDYSTIGMAFADRIPDELSAYMAGQVSSEHGDHRKSILRNLKEVEDALDQARYRRKAKSPPLSLEDESAARRPNDDSGSGGRPSSGSSSTQDATGRVGSDYLRKSREEMERRIRAHRVDTDPLPRVVWDEDGSAVQPGRAATYTRTSHIVTASARFDFYLDILEWSFQEARGRLPNDVDQDALKSICQDEVRRWFEEALSQAVVVLRPMSLDGRWGPKVFETGLSDEGLTAAMVSHRWLLLSAIKRGLAGRLGRLKDAAPQA